MAITISIMVGDSQKWIPEIVAKVKALSTGAGINNPDIAPLITKESKARVEALIESGAKQGKILLDGRGIKIPGFEKGNFVGPTVIDHVMPGMDVYNQEIFGPVMVIVRVDTLQQAIDMINSN